MTRKAQLLSESVTKVMLPFSFRLRPGHLRPCTVGRVPQRRAFASEEVLDQEALLESQTNKFQSDPPPPKSEPNLDRPSSSTRGAEAFLSYKGSSSLSRQQSGRNASEPPDPRFDPVILSEPQVFSLHVYASKNNTILSFSKPNGEAIRVTAAGALGYKGANRRSYEAAYACAMKTFPLISKARKDLVAEDELARFRVAVSFNGFGAGREAILAALLSGDGDDVRPFVSRLTDATPLKIGGTRGKKARRL